MSMSFVDELRKADSRFQHATTLEDVLCLSTLVAVGELTYLDTVDEARDFYLKDSAGDCGICPHKDKCLACLTNE